MTFYNLIAVGIGGMLGSIARYLVTKTIDRQIPSNFPFGTFSVNFLGALLLGVIYALAVRKTALPEHWRLFLGTGVCGGFTTFSAFALENYTLLSTKPLIAVLYTCLSIIAGIAGVAIGIASVRAL
jgi:fluoride exporter